MKEAKIIIAGGRDFNNYQLLIQSINEWSESGIEQFQDTELAIVSGMARGADALGVKYGDQHGIKVYEFPAEWDVYGKSAGYRRNADMAKFSDGLLAFWDGKSKGTRHMIETMYGLGKFVKVVNY